MTKRERERGREIVQHSHIHTRGFCTRIIYSYSFRMLTGQDFYSVSSLPFRLRRCRPRIHIFFLFFPLLYIVHQFVCCTHFSVAPRDLECISRRSRLIILTYNIPYACCRFEDAFFARSLSLSLHFILSACVLCCVLHSCVVSSPFLVLNGNLTTEEFITSVVHTCSNGRRLRH